MSNRRKSEPQAPRFRDSWLVELRASGLHPMAKLIAWTMSDFADWDTGERCYPTQATLAALLNTTDRTVRFWQAVLVEEGWLEKVGHRAHGIPVYALRTPARPEAGFRPDTDSDRKQASDLEASRPEAQRRQTGRPASSDRKQASDNPSIPPTVREEGKREEDAAAPPAAGAASGATREVDVAGMLAGLLPRGFGEVDRADPALLDVLADWQEAGRTREHLAAALANIPMPEKNPTGLLVTHIRKALGKPVPDMVNLEAQADPAGPVGQAPEPADAGSTGAKGKAKGKSKPGRDRELKLLSELCRRPRPGDWDVDDIDRAEAQRVLGVLGELGYAPSLYADDRGIPCLDLGPGGSWSILWARRSLTVTYFGDRVEAWREALPLLAPRLTSETNEGDTIWTATFDHRDPDTFLKVVRAMTTGSAA